jgi:hypothetical protein
MDNKKDKQFYWEVKDFFTKNPNVSAKPKSPSIIESVKNILETSKPKPKPIVNKNINMEKAVHEAIKVSENIKKAGTPEIKAFTKNISGNAFRSLKESYLHLYEQKPEEPQVYGDADMPDEMFSSPEEAANYRINNGGQDLNDIQKAIDALGNFAPGSAKGKEYVRLRDLEGKAKAAKDKKAAEDQALADEDADETAEAERIAAGSSNQKNNTSTETQSSNDNNQEQEEDQQQGGEDDGTPTREDLEDAKSQSQVDKEKAAEQSKAPEKPKDPELEARIAGRMKRREIEDKKTKISGENNLAYLQAKDTSNMSDTQRGRHAQAILNAQRRAKGEGVDTRVSADEVRAQEERGLDRERRQAGAKDAANFADKNLLNARTKDGTIKTMAELQAEKQGSDDRLAAGRAASQKATEDKLSAARALAVKNKTTNGSVTSSLATAASNVAGIKPGVPAPAGIKPGVSSTQSSTSGNEQKIGGTTTTTPTPSTTPTKIGGTSTSNTSTSNTNTSNNVDALSLLNKPKEDNSEESSGQTNARQTLGIPRQRPEPTKASSYRL